MHKFKGNRSLPEGRYRLSEVFSGLEHVKPLEKCIDDNELEKKTLDGTCVTLTTATRYMHIDDTDGSLVVGLEYLQTADERYLYLDVIHELVHVKQYLQGKELWDESYSYVDRPTELEAYECAVEESRNLGMTEDEIAEYIYVEWITRKEYSRLLKRLGIRSTRQRQVSTDSK